jgi:enolase-phosphatase E1
MLDIEGTTTPITFVTKTLFPYVTANLKNYLYDNWDSNELQEDIKLLRKQSREDLSANLDQFVPIVDEPEDLSQCSAEEKDKVIDSIVQNVKWQMDRDRKITALKQLQGHIWKRAYSSGAIKGDVFADVPVALKAWKAKGLYVFIYSSGSIEAQKLLFGHTEAGDLLQFIDGHYDTTSGSKIQSESYSTILKDISNQLKEKLPSLSMKEVLFATDNIKEAEAASTLL